MKRKLNRKSEVKTYITYDDLEKLGFGSWLKKNALALSLGPVGLIPGVNKFVKNNLQLVGTVLGATAGTIVAPGVGTLIGASIGGSLGSAVQKNEQDKNAMEAQNTAITQQNVQAAAQAQLQSELNNSPQKSFPSVMENGGTINYNGQTHSGPDGGIPIDKLGNPIVKNNNMPVASVEDGEVAFTHPKLGTYVFSNKLKYDKDKTFADIAKQIQRKYKLRMKDGKINDPISEVGYNKEMEKLIEAQEAFREVSGINKEEVINSQLQSIGLNVENNRLPIGENGIYIKPSKRGTFTEAAKKHGMGVQEFARHVLANKENYSNAMVKKANFARNASKWNKKLDGGLAGLGDSTVGIGETILPALATTIGNLWLENQMKKRTSKELNLAPIVAPRVDLSNERNIATELAQSTEANIRRNALLTGASSSQALRNAYEAAINTQRALGETLSKSYSTEAQLNAGYDMKAKEINTDIALKTSLFNTNLRNAYDDKMLALKASTANAWANAMSDFLRGKREFSSLNMLTENYKLQNKKRGTVLGTLFPNLEKVSSTKTGDAGNIKVGDEFIDYPENKNRNLFNNYFG